MLFRLRIFFNKMYENVALCSEVTWITNMKCVMWTVFFAYGCSHQSSSNQNTLNLICNRQHIWRVGQQQSFVCSICVLSSLNWYLCAEKRPQFDKYNINIITITILPNTFSVYLCVSYLHAYKQIHWQIEISSCHKNHKQKGRRENEKETETKMKERKVKGRWFGYSNDCEMRICERKTDKPLYGMTMKTFPILCANAYTEWKHLYRFWCNGQHKKQRDVNKRSWTKKHAISTIAPLLMCAFGSAFCSTVPLSSFSVHLISCSVVLVRLLLTKVLLYFAFSNIFLFWWYCE